MKKSSNMRMNTLEKVLQVVLFILGAAVIYVLVYHVARKVPFHSDDYSYFMQGLSLEAHIKHYMGWSGRFITDYTSSILLNLFDKPVYMAINSFVLMIVMITITVLPNIVMGKSLIGKGSGLILWVVFMLYWIANPNLGQTSLWLVGSANYLWTLMWAGFYFSYFLYLLNSDKQVNVGRAALLFVLGIFAGLSNESLGITVVLFTVSMFLMYWKKNKAALFVGLFSTCLGYAFVYFSPGNHARLQNDAFKLWRGLSPLLKFLDHVFGRMPGALGGFYLVYLVFIVMLLAVLWVQNGKGINVKLYAFSLIFVILSVGSIMAFIAAPSMPPRSENSGLFFALLAMSFIANVLVDTDKKAGVISLAGLGAICGIYFFFSYSFVTYAYEQTRIQADIREGIIAEAKADGSDKAVIPDWYFTRLAKDTDKFDTFRSAALPAFYGISSIEWKGVDFNYAVIKNTEPIVINKQLKEGLTLTNVYVNLNAPFEQTVAFEFNRSLMDFSQDGDEVLYIRLNIDGRDECVYADLNVNEGVQIGDKYYYGRTKLAPDMDRLRSIDYGFYNTVLGANSAEYTLEYGR
ncbi:MAG: DUF6056 family protein [Lachnospiraceae bacterium]|nr:DUF6056 family protein [Lachnospiraceae bacterium]